MKENYKDQSDSKNDLKQENHTAENDVENVSNEYFDGELCEVECLPSLSFFNDGDTFSVNKDSFPRDKDNIRFADGEKDVCDMIYKADETDLITKSDLTGETESGKEAYSIEGFDQGNTAEEFVDTLMRENDIIFEVPPLSKKVHQPKSKPLSVLSWVFFLLLIAVCLAVGYGNIRYSNPYKINGNSMLPNFKHGDMIYIIKKSPDYNQAIIFDATAINREEDTWIKRIVALEGDAIWIDEEGYLNVKNSNKCWVITEIDGKPVDPIHEKHDLKNTTEEKPFVIPEGCVYFLGDNRNLSKDCREIGPQKKEKIIGVVEGFIPEWYVFILNAKESLLSSLGCD